MIAGHPHTVRSSSVPLYMEGFPRLGQFDPSSPDFVPIDTSSFDTTGTLDLSLPPFLPEQTDIPFFQPPPIPVEPSMFDPSGGLVNTVPVVDSNTRDIANMYAGAVASGAMTPADAAAKTAAAIASATAGITPFIFSKQPVLGPGASPRVAVRPPGQAPAAASVLTQQSIKGVPNWVLLAGGAIALIAMGKR